MREKPRRPHSAMSEFRIHPGNSRYCRFCLSLCSTGQRGLAKSCAIVFGKITGLDHKSIAKLGKFIQLNKSFVKGKNCSNVNMLNKI